MSPSSPPPGGRHTRDGEVPARTARITALARAVGYEGIRDPWAERALPWRDAIIARRLRPWLVTSTSSTVHALTGTLLAHLTLRMTAVDEIVRAGVAAGATQVVIVGAGLDTRAWRLAELADATVLELDRPGVQEGKQRRLAGSGPVARDVRLVPVDLHRSDLDWVLGDVGHDPTRPTVWVWEGVAMYLPWPSVRATAEVLGARSAPGSRIAATFAHPELVGDGASGRLLAPGARLLFDRLGEPLVTFLDDAGTVDLLEEAGFTDIALSDGRAWARAAGVPPARDALGAERLAVARRA